MEALESGARRVHEFALLTKDGGRVLVRTQSSAVPGTDGRRAGCTARSARCTCSWTWSGRSR
jgi:hypothetical protein